jgi:hypothetical protein
MRTLSVVAMVVLAVASGASAQATEDAGKTRFGALDFDEHGVLTFKRHTVDPKVKGGYLGETYRIGATDVVLVTQEGGTACPVVYYLVSVTKLGATATPYIGTCNQAESIERHGDTIVFKMQGFLGPFEPEADRKKAFRTPHAFVFKDGSVTDNGKPLK